LKDVTVYRLITKGTIEEKVYHRQIFKQFDGDAAKYGYGGSCDSQTYVDVVNGQASVCVPKSSIIILTQTQ